LGVLEAAVFLACREALRALHAPGFYDKLLPVPILNLTIQAIDRAVRSKTLARFDPGTIRPTLKPMQRHLAYIGIWTVVFAAMNADRH
jgi:hypothetical protein